MDKFLLVGVLIVGGLGLILAEVCTPAFGVLALVAVGCFAWALYICFAAHPILGFVVLALLLAGLPFYLAFLLRLLPKTPLGKRLALKKLRADPGAGVPDADQHEDLIGAEGVATSVLRPSGTVTIGDRRLPATAETGFLSAGTPVRVVGSSGLNVIVRAIEEPSGSST